MTTTATEVAIQPNKEVFTPKNATESEKQKNWGQLGIQVYRKDMEFQARAQASIAKLIIPTKIEEYAKALELLKEVKAERLALSKDRKEVTNPVKDRMDELAIPENSFDIHFDKVEKACIAIKKADDERQALENKRLKELQDCRQWLTTMRNNAESAFKQLNIEKVSNVYAHALGKGDVKLNEVPELLDLAISRRSVDEFKYAFPKNTFSLVKPEEFDKMCVELLTFDANIYLADYENQLKEKFSDYAVALNNKATALANAEKEKATKAAKIESQKVNANVAAKIESVAINPVVSVTTKALKQTYAIDMPETIESVIAIMTAFTSHIDKCLPKLNVNKWFAFTPSQAGIALAKVKCDDENFNPSGITFKTVDKL